MTAMEATGPRASDVASDVAGTVKEQAREVATSAQEGVRSVAADAREMISKQARTQNDRLAGGVRQLAEELDGMAAGRQDSLARTVVARVAQGGRDVADYLDRHGPDGVLNEVQQFARRRPGAFLLTAAAAGFVMGRLGKGLWAGAPDDGRAPRPEPRVTPTRTTPMPATAPPAPAPVAGTGPADHAVGVAAVPEPTPHAADPVTGGRRR